MCELESTIGVNYWSQLLESTLESTCTAPPRHRPRVEVHLLLHLLNGDHKRLAHLDLGLQRVPLLPQLPRVESQ